MVTADIKYLLRKMQLEAKDEVHQDHRAFHRPQLPINLAMNSVAENYQGSGSILQRFEEGVLGQHGEQVIDLRMHVCDHNRDQLARQHEQSARQASIVPGPIDLVVHQPIDLIDEVQRLVPRHEGYRPAEDRAQALQSVHAQRPGFVEHRRYRDTLVQQPATLAQPPQALQADHLRLLDDRRDGRTGVTEVAEHQAVTAVDQGKMMPVDRFWIVEYRLLDAVVGTEDQPVLGAQPQKPTNLAEMGGGVDDDETADLDCLAQVVDACLGIESKALVVETQGNFDRQTAERHADFAIPQAIGAVQAEVTTDAEAQSRREGFQASKHWQK
jgi:hypothetical protein